MDLPESLAESLARKRITVAELERRSDVSRTAIERLKRGGSVRICTVESIAKGLGMKVSEFIALGES